MDADVTPQRWTMNRWQDLVLDVTIPLVFAVLTAGFLVLAAQ
jgi:hypothetical protein